jgi:hypothetical protein
MPFLNKFLHASQTIHATSYVNGIHERRLHREGRKDDRKGDRVINQMS